MKGQGKTPEEQLNEIERAIYQKIKKKIQNNESKDDSRS